MYWHRPMNLNVCFAELGLADVSEKHQNRPMKSNVCVAELGVAGVPEKH